jgi:CRP-like cAMP-binding protein
LVRLLLISRAGTEKTFCILGAGALFGEVNVIDPSPNPWLLNALQTTAVRFLPSDEARRLAREDPRLAMDLMASLARKLRMAGKQINDLSFRPVPSRVACLLLARTARPPSNAAGLTHDEIASFIGSNRETVTRTLRQMRSMGLIRYDRQLQNVVILDRRGLERIAARET